MKPRIGVLLGDPNGVGPELAVKLLVSEDLRQHADVVVIGDAGVLRSGEAVADRHVRVRSISDIEQADFSGTGLPFLEVPGIHPKEVTPGKATAAGGRSCVLALRAALSLAKRGAIDGFCFAPLNKHALKLGGCPVADEHIFFAHELDFDGPFCEHNVLEGLWTTRVTSHIALKDVCGLITAERVMRAIRLAHDTLGGAGYARPRIGVAALNPHAGDGGMFGREEIDVIAPTVEQAKATGIDAHGPFAADTVFVKARDGHFDAVVTMYHDQGQIAMKLMGFARGVTVSGGLPVPITTPASGTAFDIVGKGIANPEGLRQAFLLVCRMAEIRRQRAADLVAAG
ncbi:MAG: 4-hydroxythreonine-4-phosphate dehydrogenase PdxA [Rhodospirillales bacterium]|nr:4-hydroxythreonine-4-phosphate dehydrogenase PdxA [Rhodospirillales bacterium]